LPVCPHANHALANRCARLSAFCFEGGGVTGALGRFAHPPVCRGITQHHHCLATESNPLQLPPDPSRSIAGRRRRDCTATFYICAWAQGRRRLMSARAIACASLAACGLASDAASARSGHEGEGAAHGGEAGSPGKSGTDLGGWGWGVGEKMDAGRSRWRGSASKGRQTETVK
jgi:hypothetical protein